jgi:hypothetical protein
MNFFQLYQEFTKNSEPPANFHAWTAIAALSALLGRKCFVPQGHFTVFPNTYIVLVGPPGAKKSTAMNIGKNLVRSVEKVPVAPESATREALIDDMIENKVLWEVAGVDVSYSQSAAFVGELEQFLGGKQVNQQMVGFLTAIWDEPIFKARTRGRGEVVINAPYFTMLGCCTPSWMNNKLREDVISDGFSRRTIFCLESEPEGLVPWLSTDDSQDSLKEQLEKEARRVFNFCGSFRFTQPALDLWCVEYKKMREAGKTANDKLANYFSSKHILAMKLSMCMSAALRTDRIVCSDILQLAFRFLEVSEAKLTEVFSGVGRNELKGYMDKIYRLIQEHGDKDAGAPHALILGATSSDVSLAEFKEGIEVLTQSNLIKQEIGPNGQTVYKPGTKVEKVRSPNLLKEAALCQPNLSEKLATSVRQTNSLVSGEALSRHTIRKELQEEQLKGKISMRKFL